MSAADTERDIIFALLTYNCAKRNISRRKPNITAKQYNSPQANIVEGPVAP